MIWVGGADVMVLTLILKYSVILIHTKYQTLKLSTRRIFILALGPLFLVGFFRLNLYESGRNARMNYSEASKGSMVIDSTLATDSAIGISMWPSIQYYLDSSATKDFEQVLQASFVDQGAIPSFEGGILWKKLTFISKNVPSAWYFGTLATETKYIIQSVRGSSVTGTVGTDVVNNGDLFHTVSNPFIPIDLQAYDTVQLVWCHGRSNASVNVSNQLWRFVNVLANKPYIYKWHIKRLWQTLPVVFILFTVFFYHVVLYIFNQNQTYLLLGLSAFSAILLMAHDNDLIVQIFSIRNIGKFANYGFPLSYISNLVVFPFTISYLEIKKGSTSQKIIIAYMVIAFIGWILYFFINLFELSLSIPQRTQKNILGLVFMTGNLLLFLIVLRELFRANRNAVFFFAGYGTAFVGYVATLLWAFGYFSLENHQLPTAVGFLLFSLGLADKMSRLEKEQSEAARQRDLALMQKNLEQQESRRLKEVDQFKSQLYTNITHEFRTPLTVIAGVADQLPSQGKQKALIKRSADQLLNLVNQMLELTKIDTGHLQLNLKQVDIIPLIKYLCENYQLLAQNQGKDFQVKYVDESIWMDLDATLFERILNNLVHNALKFTPKGGRIHIGIDKDAAKSAFYIKISDTGTGIPKDQFDKIFERFYQIDASTTRHGEGTGIGLALVKELAELMHGEIKVESQQNAGSTFTLTLPITQQAPREIWKPTSTTARPTTVNHAPSNHTTPSDAKQILLAEDHADVRYYISSLLPDYQIIEADNGRQALDLALQEIPDLLISDIMMPEMDGYQLCRKLKSDLRTSHIPIILLTAKSTQEDRLEGLQGGADAYLTKPFDKRELLVRIDQLLDSREKIWQHFQQFQMLPQEAIRENEFLEKVRSVVEANFGNEHFQIDALAKEIHLSRNQLYRKLKALTGKTFTDIVREMKIHRAQALLTKTDKTISEIAYDLGFRDQSYFTKVFKNSVGKTPSELRR